MSKIYKGASELIGNTPLVEVTNIEKDTTRIQLLTLIKHDPDNAESILKVARHYFVDLSGDWYATAIFQNWCAERDIHVDWQMPI